MLATMAAVWCVMLVAAMLVMMDVFFANYVSGNEAHVLSFADRTSRAV